MQIESLEIIIGEFKANPHRFIDMSFDDCHTYFKTTEDLQNTDRVTSPVEKEQAFTKGKIVSRGCRPEQLPAFIAVVAGKRNR